MTLEQLQYSLGAPQKRIGWPWQLRSDEVFSLNMKGDSVITISYVHDQRRVNQ